MSLILSEHLWFITSEFYAMFNFSAILLNQAPFVLLGGSLSGMVTNVLDCDIIVNQFEPLSCYFIYFLTNTLGKGINPFLTCCRLNITTTVFLQSWLWHLFTHEDGFTIKQTNLVLLAMYCFKILAHWPSWSSVRHWSGRPAFNPRSHHTKDF